MSTAKLPHDDGDAMRHKRRMSDIDHFLRVIDEELGRSGESDRSLSLRATSSADTIRNARRHQAIPSHKNLLGLADALHLTVDQLLGRPLAAETPPRSVEVTHAPGVGDVSRTFRRSPQDLPVRGTALGHNLHFDDKGSADIEVTLFDPGEALHYIVRPPALLNNDTAYAIYVQGDSMAPAHKDGALRVVNPRAPLRVGDDVVVQLHDADGDDGQAVVSVLIKTLVKRSASFVVLQQLNPAREFRVPAERITAIHRVMELDDLLG